MVVTLSAPSAMIAFPAGAAASADLGSVALRHSAGLANKSLENQIITGVQAEKTANLMQDIQTGKMNNDFAQMKDIVAGYDD